jgi:murein DD-endopeptidase MepM/ murein hydrolase activator NlpD
MRLTAASFFMVAIGCGGERARETGGAIDRNEAPPPAVHVDASSADGAWRAPDGYGLPWPPSVRIQLTQDCNDDCCSDHIGNDAYAWDFANGESFPIRAARGGTITHLKTSSTTGCGSSSCVDQANLIVIDHGDGTESVYLHIANGSLAPGVTCGSVVMRGQPLAMSGDTGWSTGTHLHYQVNPVHSDAPTCECGADGTECAPTTAPWADFWPNKGAPTVPIAFDEWSTSSVCSNRRMVMPTSFE